MLQVLLVMDYFDTVEVLKRTIIGVSIGTPFLCAFCKLRPKCVQFWKVKEKGFCKFSMNERLTKSLW